METSKKINIPVLGLVMILQLIIYAPHVGTGFVTDDFVWLGSNMVKGEMDFLRPFTVITGFYRPLPGLSFALQYKLHGMNPGPYGWFNLLFHLLNILMVYVLVSSLKAFGRYALPVAVLFALNAKGVPMAVAWISGRTTLLCTFFVLLSLYFYLQARKSTSAKTQRFKRTWRYLAAAAAYAAALLSKETAIAVPVFVFLFVLFYPTITDSKDVTKISIPAAGFLKKFRYAFSSILIFIPSLTVYFILRLQSNAYTPLDAPDIYRYTLEPKILLKNIWEYLTRAGMLDVLILGGLVLVILFSRRSVKTGEEKKIDRPALAAGIVWFSAFLLPLLTLPVRSDLYVYLPQVGIHFMTMAWLFYLWEKNRSLFNERKKRITVLLLPVLLLSTWMVSLFIRAGEYGKAGKISTDFTRQLIPAVSEMKNWQRIVIIDLDSEKSSSPSRSISYGLEPLMALYYPGKYLKGEIIGKGKVSRWKDDPHNLYFFSWRNGQLLGPLSGDRLQHVIFSLYLPCPGSVEIREKSQKPIHHRPQRLKKRKQRLRKNKDQGR
jgi:hypothetical protein